MKRKDELELDGLIGWRVSKKETPVLRAGVSFRKDMHVYLQRCDGKYVSAIPLMQGRGRLTVGPDLDTYDDYW